MKLYRKTCNNSECKRKFKGGKLAKYCSASCKQKAYNLRKGKGYAQLKKLLILELSYVGKGDLKGIVAICLESVKRWRKGGN